jgi:hypothetical protein
MAVLSNETCYQENVSLMLSVREAAATAQGCEGVFCAKSRVAARVANVPILYKIRREKHPTRETDGHLI